jgi:hypothetical protein
LTKEAPTGEVLEGGAERRFPSYDVLRAMSQIAKDKLSPEVLNQLINARDTVYHATKLPNLEGIVRGMRLKGPVSVSRVGAINPKASATGTDVSLVLPTSAITEAGGEPFVYPGYGKTQRTGFDTPAYLAKMNPDFEFEYQTKNPVQLNPNTLQKVVLNQPHVEAAFGTPQMIDAAKVLREDIGKSPLAAWTKDLLTSEAEKWMDNPITFDHVKSFIQNGLDIPVERSMSLHDMITDRVRQGSKMFDPFLADRVKPADLPSVVLNSNGMAKAISDQDRLRTFVNGLPDAIRDGRFSGPVDYYAMDGGPIASYFKIDPGQAAEVFNKAVYGKPIFKSKDPYSSSFEPTLENMAQAIRSKLDPEFLRQLPRLQPENFTPGMPKERPNLGEIRSSAKKSAQEPGNLSGGWEEQPIPSTGPTTQSGSWVGLKPTQEMLDNGAIIGLHPEGSGYGSQVGNNLWPLSAISASEGKKVNQLLSGKVHQFISDMIANPAQLDGDHVQLGHFQSLLKNFLGGGDKTNQNYKEARDKLYDKLWGQSK